MTFCIAVKVDAGVVAVADTRVVKGVERLNKRKLSLHGPGGARFFIMTSGLRSIRDKIMTYMELALHERDLPPSRLFEVANLIGDQLRRVRAEDEKALARSGLSFNFHAIIGGRSAGDAAPTLFLIYPEGNWIEINDESPYLVIGRTPYAHALLVTQLQPRESIGTAAAVAILAFDMTAASVTDVDYPADVAIMPSGSFDLELRRYTADDLAPITAAWRRGVSHVIRSLPDVRLVADGGIASVSTT